MMFACCVADSQDGLPIEVVERVPEAAPATPVEPEPEPVAKRADGSQVGVVLIFELPDKTMRDIIFASRPLGIDFSRSLKVKRVKPEGPGLSQGVSEGWVLKHIAGTSVPDTSVEFNEQLQEHVKALPLK
ncbi:unnamed protein product [Polarella glacialis]|uniref:Uncharacterized protein n=1 Tax=Polarella glacialis TaxID=89957 RepID=A0A813KL26_POLGL|nr:unnamed protein product [Polarella glacialis]